MNLENLSKQIEADEGWMPYVYDDATGVAIVPGSTVKGHPTIGYGFNVQKGATPLPKPIANDWLTLLLVAVEHEVFTHFTWVASLPEPVQEAMVNMAYNMGIECLSEFKNMLAALKARNGAEAKKQALDSAWAREVGPRATRIANTFERYLA